MRWPWERDRRKIADADRKVAEADSRLEYAKQLAAESEHVRKTVNRVVKKNHWTELLVESMQRGN